MRSVPPSRLTKPAKILLVDDNYDGVDARTAILQELGYTIISAHCGLEALKQASEQDLDLIITDFKMQPMDGLELIKKLRENDFQKQIGQPTGTGGTKDESEHAQPNN